MEQRTAIPVEVNESWYRMTSEEALSTLESDLHSGLSRDEARQRLDKYGLNELVDKGAINPWKILFSQFTETMVLVLIGAAAISAFLGEFRDAGAVLVIVILNGLLGFRQEYQAEKAMEALKKLAVPTVRVRREFHVEEISSRELVPGDIVLLEAGNLVPADARLLEAPNLRAQEAALTGESEPVNKVIDPVERENPPLAERRNMVFMGTVISFGRGQALVTATGMNTELGKIAGLIQESGDNRTPLQVRLDKLGKTLALLAVMLVLVVAGIGLYQGEDLRTIFLTAISMSVAAIPEGLAAVVTISLALGARRMLRRKALIRKLPAVEGLGSVTVICSDKTGTLTENRMTVTVIDVANNRVDLAEEFSRSRYAWQTAPCSGDLSDHDQMLLIKEYPALSLTLFGGALCNDAFLECDEDNPNNFRIVGDPTEGALVVAAARMGMNKVDLEKAFPRVAEVPFESDRKRMTTVHKTPETSEGEAAPARRAYLEDVWPGQEKYISITKGAMDSLLAVSDVVWNEGNVEPITDSWIKRIEEANANLAGHGMRVLGVAYRTFDELPSEISVDTLENSLIFVGLVGMIDPARSEVKDAVATCKRAGVRPMMITGDHPLTARYIARELGIGSVDDGRVVTGAELDKVSQQELEALVSEASVYARVSPENKLQIVKALQARGEIAAMTGDGVNDAPALRTADIGVAMGITGTDVSKEASDIILLDDNFATIVAAVEEGRTIYDNIRKFIKYTMSSNAGEIWVMLIAPFLGMPLALLPLQILWINLVTDGLPGLALGVEPAERDTMRRPPYPPNENIFARGVGTDILWVGILMGLISLGVGYTYWLRDIPYWQTMIFTTLTLSEMGYVMAIRSNRDSLFQIGILSNKAMLGAVLLTTVLQIAVVYVPFLQELLGTQALPVRDLLICMALASTLFFAVEIKKFFIRAREGRMSETYTGK